MNSKFNKYIVSFCLVFICSLLYAKDPPSPSGETPNPGLPIDGGLAYLLISGLAYGFYELKRKK